MRNKNADAFLRVGFLVEPASRSGSRVIFKKTDSVLKVILFDQFN